MFKSRTGQIGHSAANGLPSLRHFFERSCFARALLMATLCLLLTKFTTVITKKNSKTINTKHYSFSSTDISGRISSCHQRKEEIFKTFTSCNSSSAPLPLQEIGYDYRPTWSLRKLQFFLEIRNCS